MMGPFAMTPQVVELVPRSPGAYALSNDGNGALFVGRSDADLRARLQEHFAHPGADSVVVTRFWYELAPSAWHAYLLECHWYHTYAPTHNAGHPARPFGALLRCPICGR